MTNSDRKTGIDIVGNVPWGTHLCQFYHTKEDLLDILVPYFKAGLENNEFCMWVASEPLEVDKARASLGKAVKDLDGYIARGQIEILDYSDWYTKSGKFSADEVLQGWVDKEHQALEKGFDGLRLTGNTFWLEERDWASFTEYEGTVDSVIGQYKMIAICTYSLDKCKSIDAIDVVSNHEFALIRREGQWSIIESARRRQAIEDVIKSEARWRSLVENAPNMIMQTDCDGIIHFMNRVIPGLGLEDVIGKSIYDYIQPEYHDVARETINGVIKTGANDSYEIRGVGPDKRMLWYNTTISPVLDNGKIIGFIHVILDITEKKRLEHDLRERVKELSCLYDIAKIAANEGTTFDELCQGVANLLPASWSHSEIACARITINGSKFETENYRDTEWKQSSDIKVLGEKIGVIDISYLEKRPEFDEGPFTKEEELLLDAVAERLGSIVEQEQAEQALQESEEKLRLMFESVTEGVTITDLNGNVIDTNEATVRIHGFDSRQQLIGRSAFELIAERDHAKATENLEKTLTEGCSGTLEYTLLREDGNEFPGELVASLMRDATGNPVGFVAITRDITERKRAEQTIAEKNRALEEANAQLQEVDRLKSIFLSSMSHELRTPLNSIIGFTSLILDGMTGDINEEQKEQLTLVKSSSHHLLSLINDVLDISKIEAGRVELTLEEFPLNECVSEVIELLTPAAQTKGIELMAETDGDIRVYTDRRHFKQVLINLGGNAVKFTEQGSVRIITGLHKKNGHIQNGSLEIHVVDTGIGIKKKDIDKLFAPFQQVDGSLTRRFEGTGLGLHLSKKILTMLGGNIWIKSRYGKGSDFGLTLPLRYEGDEDNEESSDSG